MGETDSSVLILACPRRNGRTLVEDWEIEEVGISQHSFKVFRENSEMRNCMCKGRLLYTHKID